MGGYNTLCEILSFERPAVIVPRVQPIREQLVRTELLHRGGLVEMIHPDELTPARLRVAVDRLPRRAAGMQPRSPAPRRCRRARRSPRHRRVIARARPSGASRSACDSRGISGSRSRGIRRWRPCASSRAAGGRFLDLVRRAVYGVTGAPIAPCSVRRLRVRRPRTSGPSRRSGGSPRGPLPAGRLPHRRRAEGPPARDPRGHDRLRRSGGAAQSPDGRAAARPHERERGSRHGGSGGSRVRSAMAREQPSWRSTPAEEGWAGRKRSGHIPGAASSPANGRQRGEPLTPCLLPSSAPGDCGVPSSLPLDLLARISQALWQPSRCPRLFLLRQAHPGCRSQPARCVGTSRRCSDSVGCGRRI